MEESVDSELNCKEPLNFLCSLPELCHNEICKFTDEYESPVAKVVISNRCDKNYGCIIAMV